MATRKPTPGPPADQIGDFASKLRAALAEHWGDASPEERERFLPGELAQIDAVEAQLRASAHARGQL